VGAKFAVPIIDRLPDLSCCIDAARLRSAAAQSRRQLGSLFRFSGGIGRRWNLAVGGVAAEDAGGGEEAFALDDLCLEAFFALD
jgi:hypothetical protein